MARTHEQEIAALKSEIESLKGQIKGLQYAVAVHPYPIHHYIPAPVPARPVPVYPYPPNVWYSQSSVAQGNAGDANTLSGATCGGKALN